MSFIEKTKLKSHHSPFRTFHKAADMLTAGEAAGPLGERAGQGGEAAGAVPGAEHAAAEAVAPHRARRWGRPG